MSTMKLMCAVVLVAATAGEARSHGHFYGYHVSGYRAVYPAYPVYYYPPPVIYAPAPVVYAAPPVVYEEPVVVEAPYPPPPPVVCRVKCGEVEIDSLKAKACYRAEGLELRIRYEVEFERVPLANQQIVVEFIDQGRVIADAEGHAIVAMATLDRPSEVDDDEVEFKGRLSTLLPTGSFSHPKHLRLQARVIDASGGGVLAIKSGKVDLDD